ncbi:MAG: rimL [Rickettsiaceae bacterium]|jgi:RimJ/RimL family protein N-acetyltransferase|nr:rimL [Rickettsiaceae bacterium]
MIQTPRLILRHWKESDLLPFAALNADPEVMRFFPSTLTKEESDAMAERIKASFTQDGFGLWAAELKEEGQFIGFIGLNRPSFEAHFTPCVEISWRLAKEYWNKGYATEGAKAALEYGFNKLDLHEIVSFTAVINTPSRRVMEKIGMKREPQDDFDHPKLSDGNPLLRHVLYRKQP